MVHEMKINCNQCSLSGQAHMCDVKRTRSESREKKEAREKVAARRRDDPRETEVKFTDNDTRGDGGSADGNVGDQGTVGVGGNLDGNGVDKDTRGVGGNSDGNGADNGTQGDGGNAGGSGVDKGMRGAGGSADGNGVADGSSVVDGSGVADGSRVVDSRSVAAISEEQSLQREGNVSGGDYLQQAAPLGRNIQPSDSAGEVQPSMMVSASSTSMKRAAETVKDKATGLPYRAALDATNVSLDSPRQNAERDASERERIARLLENEREKAARLQDKLDQMQRIVDENKEEENRRLREKVQKLEQREARRDDERRSVGWASATTVDAEKLRDEEKCQRVSEVEQAPAARLNLTQCRQLNAIEEMEAARLKEFEADRMRFLSDMETEKQRVMSGAGVSTSRASMGSVATVLRPTATIGEPFDNVKVCESENELQEILQTEKRGREERLRRLQRYDALQRELEAAQREIEASDRELVVSNHVSEENKRAVQLSTSTRLPGNGSAGSMMTGRYGVTTELEGNKGKFVQLHSTANGGAVDLHRNDTVTDRQRGEQRSASSGRNGENNLLENQSCFGHRKKLNKKSARLPMFDGSSQGEYAFTFWEDSFKSEMEEGEIDKSRWMFNLQRSLSGAALELYQQTVVFFPEASYDYVVERLCREFDRLKTPLEYKQDCEKLQWEKGEKIEQFGDRCYAACARLHRDENELLKEAMIKREVYDVFMRCMTNHYRTLLRTRSNLVFPGKKVIDLKNLVDWVRELVDQQEDEDMMRRKYRIERNEQGRFQSPVIPVENRRLPEKRVQFDKEVTVFSSDSLSKHRQNRIAPVQVEQNRSVSNGQYPIGQNRPFDGGYQGQRRYGQQNLVGNRFGNGNNWQPRQQNYQNFERPSGNKPPNQQQLFRPQIGQQQSVRPLLNTQQSFRAQGNEQRQQQQGFRQPYRSQNAGGSMQRPQQQPQGSHQVNRIDAEITWSDRMDDMVDMGPSVSKGRWWNSNRKCDNGSINVGSVQSIVLQKGVYIDPLFTTRNFFGILQADESDEEIEKREHVAKLGGFELFPGNCKSKRAQKKHSASSKDPIPIMRAERKDLGPAPVARTEAWCKDPIHIMRAERKDLGPAPVARTEAWCKDPIPIMRAERKDLGPAPVARTEAWCEEIICEDPIPIMAAVRKDLGPAPVARTEAWCEDPIPIMAAVRKDLGPAPVARTEAWCEDPIPIMAAVRKDLGPAPVARTEAWFEDMGTANMPVGKAKQEDARLNIVVEKKGDVIEIPPPIVTLPMRVEGKGKVFEAQVDTGSPIVIINKEIMKILIERHGNEDIGKKMRETNLTYCDVQKRQIKIDGVIDIEFEVLGKKVVCQTMVMTEAAQPILVGMKFMQKIGMDLGINLGKSRFVWAMEPSTFSKDGIEKYGTLTRMLDGKELPRTSERSERLSKKKDERTRCKALAVGKETSPQGTEKQSAYLLRVFNIKESEAGFGKMIMGDRDHWRDKEVLIEGGTPKGGVVIPDQLAQIDNEGLVWVEIVNHNAESMSFGPGEIAVNVSEFYQRSRITANHSIDACVKCRANASNNTVAFVHTPTSTPNYFNLPVGDMRERRQIIREKLELEKNNPFLSESDCERVKDFLAENHDVIALDDYDLGKCNLTDFAHKIDTGDTPPIAIPRRRIPQGMREGEQNAIDTMLSTGVIRPSKSPWSSPIVPVQKPDGSIRICVDYRKLNSVTKKDRYPLTRCDDLVDSMGDVGPEIFTTLDLVQGYHQQIMDPESIEKTAFTCSAGHFEYTRLPMGLTNSPANFQRLQTELLRGLDGNRIKVYLDDVAIVSKTVDEHLDLLDDVFDRFRQAGLRVKLKKCKFLRTEVLYLGYIVNRDGMKPNPARLESVANARAPKTVKEIRQFLGLCSFYRRFVKNFSVIALPLSELTKKEQKWVWGDKQQKAFETLKERLLTPPLLRYPTFNKPFYIFCDASVEGLGAVLNQKDEEGKYYVVAYASRSTHQSERFYTATELECLCIAWALTQFHFYIWNQEVTIETDHKPLECLPGKATLPARIERWNTLISSYGPTIVYRKGSENGPADMLSRYGQEAGSAKEKAFDEIELLGLVNDLEQRESWQNEQRSLQMEDTDFKEVILSLENKPVAGTNEHRKQIKKMQTHYHLEKGVLYFEALVGEQPRICVAKQEREGLIRTYHQMKYAGAHFGAGKTYKSMSQRFFWPRMKQEVREFCQKCLVCAKQKGVEQCQRQPMTAVTVPGQPFEQIGIDIMKLTKTKKGNIKVLGIVDYFSGYIIFVPIKDETAVTVASKLVKHVFNVYGAPKTIVSDQGVNFTSLILEELERIYQVKHNFTTTFMPRANGKIERANQTVQRILTRMMVDYPEEWDELVSHVTFAFNGVSHETTGLAPYLVVFGHYPPPLHESIFDRRAIGNRLDLDDYVSELQRRLAYVHKVVVNAVGKSQVRYKKQFDKTTKESPITTGDTVMLYRPDLKKTKLSPRFDGPFAVIWTNATNAGIRKFGKKAIEMHNLEKLSRCPQGMEQSGQNVEKERKKRRVVEGKNKVDVPKTNHYNLRDREIAINYVRLQMESTEANSSGYSQAFVMSLEEQVDGGLLGAQNAQYVRRIKELEHQLKLAKAGNTTESEGHDDSGGDESTPRVIGSNNNTGVSSAERSPEVTNTGVPNREVNNGSTNGDAGEVAIDPVVTDPEEVPAQKDRHDEGHSSSKTAMASSSKKKTPASSTSQRRGLPRRGASRWSGWGPLRYGRGTSTRYNGQRGRGRGGQRGNTRGGYGNGSYQPYNGRGEPPAHPTANFNRVALSRTSTYVPAPSVGVFGQNPTIYNYNYHI